MKDYIISENLADAILNYLVTQPMQDVENLVSALRHVKQLEEKGADNGESSNN